MTDNSNINNLDTNDKLPLSNSERQKRYRQNHPDKVREYQKVYKQKNTDKVKVWSKCAYNKKKEKNIIENE